MKNKKCKICYLAGREYDYTRTRTMIKALEIAGYAVETCLPVDKRFRHYPKLIWEFITKSRDCDVVVVGFYGQILLPIIRVLTRKPIIFDIHSGTFETMIDWGRARSGSLKAWLYFWADKITMTLADKIILESRDHIRNWSAKFGIPESKFGQIFLAADNFALVPKEQNGHSGRRFLVHFHGEFAPFHGVEHILRAAHLLRNEEVAFQIIGFGTTYADDMRLAQKLQLTNCNFIRWVPYDELGDYMTRADVCLGFFGDRQRAYEVFTNKVVEAIAVEKPLITMRNQPVQELLQDGVSVILTEPGNPEAIAAAILRLKNDPALRREIAAAGHAAFLKHCTLERFAESLDRILSEYGFIKGDTPGNGTANDIVSDTAKSAERAKEVGRKRPHRYHPEPN